MNWLWIAPIAGIISIAVGAYLYWWVVAKHTAGEKQLEISAAIMEGAYAYLKRLYQALAGVVVVVGIVLLIMFDWETALAYVIGSLFSAAAGYLGMSVALRANARTAWAAQDGLGAAFPIGFYAGGVMGLAVVGVALLGMSILYAIFGEVQVVLGFSFGASALALLAKAGGGIYTKTADIGADLVGKVELSMPEDDPRNPAVIADNVGDNVGDVAGMGADIFDSYVASMVAAMLLGAELYSDSNPVFIILPLILASVGVFASLVGMYLVRVKEGENPGRALNRGTIFTCVAYTVLALAIILLVDVGMGVFWATIAGMLAGVVIGFTSDYYTSIEQKAVKDTAEACLTGPAITILTGFSYGLISIVPAVLGIVAATLASYYVAEATGLDGVYGIAMAAVGMLSISGMIVTSDAYGPIVDNSAGIAEMSGMDESVIQVGEELDAAGNTAKAITKGFAIGAAALTVLALFHAYSNEVGLPNGLDLLSPVVLSGIFLGAMMPPLFSALTILSVGRNAFVMVNEVRRQFREIPGLMEGTGKPDYAKCVDIASTGAMKELILPGLLALVTPVLVGFILGKYALGGFLGGSIFTGLIFALFMANSGGLWDNAKKYIESGAHGGKGSEAHKAAVVGDTVGDPFKDTAGPSLNTLITVMSLVATVFAPFMGDGLLGG